MATYKVVNDLKVKQRKGLVISCLDKAPDLFGMSLKLICKDQIYDYNLIFDDPKAIVINSPDSFVGKVIEFIPEEKGN